MTDWFVDPVRRQRYRLTLTGDTLVGDVWALPGGDIPEHRHPRQHERFEVTGGVATFRIDGREVVAGAGQGLEAPAGVPHAFLNRSGAEVRFRFTVTPALDLEGYMREVAVLARAGKLSRRSLPRGPKAALELAELAHRYSDTVMLTSPPPLLQRLCFPALAAASRGMTRRLRHAA